MRLEKATWHNMGPFSDWSLDLTALDPAQKVVALTGVNGRGKSFCMESAVAGGCYRSMPTQGSVSARATAADSWQESTVVVGGKRYQIKHLVNAAAKKRTGESIVTGDDGKPVYEGTGVALFDGWAAKTLPDPDVLFASLFAAQQSEGFVKMTSGDRIGVILRVIGVARLERMAEAARKRRDAEAEKLDVVTKRIADIRGDALTVEQCEALLTSARETVASFELQLEERRAGFAAAQEADAAAQVLEAQRQAAHREIAALCEQRDQLQARRKPVAEMVANNRAVQADAANIRKAAEVVADLEAKVKADEDALLAANTEARTVLAPWTGWKERHYGALARADRAAQRAKDAAAVQAAKSALPDLRDALTEAEAEVARLTGKLQELQDAHIAGAGERIAGYRASVETMKELASNHAAHDEIFDVAVGALTADDEAVTLAQQHPALTKEAKERLASAKDKLLAAQRQVNEAERLAARSGEVDGADAERAEAVREAAEIAAGYAKASDDAKGKEAVVQELQTRIAANRLMLTSLRPVAAKLAPLENSDTRLAELVPLLEGFDADLAKVEAALAATPPVPEEPKRPDLKALQGQLERAEALLRFERDGLAKLDQSLEAAKAVEAKVAELEQERRAIEAELGICTRLALDFGRTGLQSAEVDSAGPELTELVNDLLHRCLGHRFTVSVETQRLSGDGKKTIDECNISVVDTEKGTEKEVREHSGGERVILGEAISLALTMLACRRAGFERPTLFRDESAAALDPANARAWVAMMRRAVELTGADRLLFVSHSPEVVEMADAQIAVGEGDGPADSTPQQSLPEVA
jgi:DNA repair protein SbcC/Rad50